ncbi:MAG: hypothetical protein HQ518_07115 [Rhodopirellula sp.]|nr:hypothetical protein [Rhodopirellula sp.]
MMVRRQLTIQHRETARRALKRRGSLALAAMMSLLVIVGGVAVALDRLWLDSAKTELEAAVEAAALRGGQLLASDDLLRLEADIEARLERARQEAGMIASENQIAGKPVELDLTPEGDIRFGRLVRRDRTGEEVFIETTDQPTSVVVRGLHSRSRNNPVAMFLNSVSGNEGADVSALSEASIDNRVVGFQPLAGAPVPALPLAILRQGEEGDSRESWKSQIEDRRGADEYGFDERTGKVTDGPDGIPEIRLRSAIRRGNAKKANVHLFDVNGAATVEELLLHVRNGWGEQDLPKHLTELRLDQKSHVFETANGISGALPRVLKEQIGVCRILFLYDNFQPTGRSGAGRIQVTQAVAGRVLSVKVVKDDGCELIIQPGVMTTRTALLAANHSDVESDQHTKRGEKDGTEKLTNRYIYKLQITN